MKLAALLPKGTSSVARTLRPRSQRFKFLLLVKALIEKEGKTLDSMSQKEIMRRFHIAERTLEKALADLKNCLLKEK